MNTTLCSWFVLSLLQRSLSKNHQPLRYDEVYSIKSLRNIPRAATSQTQRAPPPPTDQGDCETKPSRRFLKIYFMRTNFKTMLQNNSLFNTKLKALPPQDIRRQAVFQIVQERFKELTLQEVNLLICQHQVSEKFYIYFSDAEWIPLSRCCQNSIFVVLSPSSHKVDIFCSVCNRSLTNPPKSAVQSATLLAKTAFQQYGHSLQEQRERQKVSRMIVSGKFRKVNLKQVYNEPLEKPQEEQTIDFDQKFVNKEREQQESTILELKELINELF